MTDGVVLLTASCSTSVSPGCTDAGTRTRWVVLFAFAASAPTYPISASGGSGGSVGAAVRWVCAVAPAPSVTVSVAS
ncbi:hypothetical protein L615_008500000090 [Nocardioides sp. J9]|nr:hypothetical protein L615_008500000090 [Nocardioides sp. J9]